MKTTDGVTTTVSACDCGVDQELHPNTHSKRCKSLEPTVEKWEPSESQKKYWDSMKGKTGESSPRWKGKEAGKSAKHSWISKHYGSPKVCENIDCPGKSKWFDWCIKTGREYSHDRNDYLRLCRSCHRKYDLTPDIKEKAVKNLWWKRGIENPGSTENVANLWWKKDKQKMEEYYANKKLGK